VAMSSETPAVIGPTRSFFTRPETTDGVIYQVFDHPGADLANREQQLPEAEVLNSAAARPSTA